MYKVSTNNTVNTGNIFQEVKNGSDWPEITLPLVAMAEMESAVTEVTVTDIRIISQVNTEVRKYR